MLERMRELDGIVGSMFPSGEMGATGLGEQYVVELSTIARRTFGSVSLLLEWSLVSGETDRTEDAAVLVRRLLEILARMIFVVDQGDSPDVQAMRCEYADLTKQEKAQREVLKMSDTPAHQVEHDQLLGGLKAIVAQLEEDTGTAKRAPNTLDILKKADPALAVLWRHDSDVVHFGSIGRSYQRRGLTLGTPAAPERQAMVGDLAIAFMGHIAKLRAKLLGENTARLDGFSERRKAELRA